MYVLKTFGDKLYIYIYYFLLLELIKGNQMMFQKKGPPDLKKQPFTTNHGHHEHHGHGQLFPGGRIGWCHSMTSNTFCFLFVVSLVNVKLVLLVFDTCAWLK